MFQYIIFLSGFFTSVFTYFFFLFYSTRAIILFAHLTDAKSSAERFCIIQLYLQ